MSEKQLSREGPTWDEMEIIGMELAIRPDDRREVELEMVGVKRIVPNSRYANSRVRVTVHTSDGDITMVAPMRPGNYQMY